MARRRSPRSLLRKLAGDTPQPRPPHITAVPPPQRVDDAELDQLRAELVRELDGRAAGGVDIFPMLAPPYPGQPPPTSRDRSRRRDTSQGLRPSSWLARRRRSVGS